MTLTNIYTKPDPVDTTPRVPFNTLKWGQSYKHSNDGQVSQVHFIGPGWITVKRADDWLVRIKCGSETWNKNVIKI